MFMGREELDNLAETFVYVDLLSAIMAILVLYEARDVRAEQEAASVLEKEQLRTRIEELETQVAELKFKLEELIES